MRSRLAFILRQTRRPYFLTATLTSGLITSRTYKLIINFNYEEFFIISKVIFLQNINQLFMLNQKQLLLLENEDLHYQRIV